jgi:hypothetical protein
MTKGLNVKTNRATYDYSDRFDVDYSINWNDVGGNYLFAGNTGNGWKLYYVGITDSFKNRMSGHPQIVAAKRLGATHIFAHTNPNAAVRMAEEADIIAYFQPPLNRQLK